MRLETLIEQNYHRLNENDLYIWEYIRIHPRECRDISIDALSGACCTSHTTILRFAKKLGLSGFSELKVILKWQEQPGSAFHPDELTRTMQDYQQTMEYLCTVDFSDLFALIQQAGQIYIYGSGSVQQRAARDLKEKFFHSHKLMHIVEGETDDFYFPVRQQHFCQPGCRAAKEKRPHRGIHLPRAKQPPDLPERYQYPLFQPRD